MSKSRRSRRRQGSATTQAPHLPTPMRSAAVAWLGLHADAGLIVLAALLATLPLLLRGTSCGHDLSFHLLNWMEVATQWSHGTLRPFWAFHAAWNAGEPRFVFYPPLSWTLGALLGLVLPWTATPIAYTVLTLTLCGLTMRVLLRQLVTPTLAAVGACVYLANPYMLFVAYERAAYAELLAAAWMPLLLLAALQSRLRPLRLAIVIALLWLTNAPAAVVGSYALLLISLVRLARLAARPRAATSARSSTVVAVAREAGQLSSGYLLGLALAGFYLLPALAQRRFVQLAMAILPGMRPSDSFLFGHTADAFHDAVLRSASWIATGVLGIALACTALLLWRGQKHHANRSMHSLGVALQHQRNLDRTSAVSALAILSCAILFLLTPFSAAVWTHAPQLAFLQFPWRFLSIEAAVATVLLLLVAASLPGSQRKATPWVVGAAMLFAAAMPWAGYALYHQACDDEDTPAAQREGYVTQRGTETTDEYTPATADNEALHQDLPAAWLTTDADSAPTDTGLNGIILTGDGNPSHLQFDLRAAAQPRTLVIRLRQYPGWTLSLDGAPQPSITTRDDGLFTVDLPPGLPHTVTLRYRWTRDEVAGLALSLAAALLLILLWPRRNAGQTRTAT